MILFFISLTLSNVSSYVNISVLEQFKNDKKPLLLTLGVGSYSLNLQFCNEIVYSSISFDYAKIEQSKYRIKRTGQQRDIEYYYILSDLGINKMIFENLDKKEALSTIIANIINCENIDDFIEKNL